MITPHEWPQVRALFHDALQRPVAERAAFVHKATARLDIRQEVESLLAAEHAAEGFLSTPPVALTGRRSPTLLAPHTRLNHFEILGLLGAGGMGEVYRARDTRLDRTVAIKVLSRDLALHPDARERFEREARIISRFSHPHVCTLHDVGNAVVSGTETQFLVMELVAGESLATRLQRGALPSNESVRTGIEILEALTAAHAAGVIHRDLKPANVMLTPSGVKLLDFGVARLVRTAAPEGEPLSGARDPLSKDGHVLGTLPYMSPEQLRGEEADTRSDIFAFGALLYEMVTGSRAFEAESDTAIVAAILERDPVPIAALRTDAPRGLDRIVQTCLAKAPDDRWPRARDVLRELTWLRDDSGHRVTMMPLVRSRRRDRIATAAAVAIVAVLLTGVLLRQETPAPARVSFTLMAPKGHTFSRATAEIAVSPDSTRLAFVALASDGTRLLWVRSFEAPEAHSIAGTEGATYPFWSPNGRSLGFFASSRLKRVNADGTGLEELSDAQHPRGGTWSRDGTIVFGADTALRRVAAAGGATVEVTRHDAARQDRVHGWPVFLPDGRRFLFLALSIDPAQSGVFQSSLDSDRSRRVLTAASSFAVAGSRMLWLDRRRLLAQTFDSDRAELVGEAEEIASGVGIDTRTMLAGVAASGAALVYRAVGDQSRLTWYDRNGRALETFREPGDYQHPAISPDGKRIAVEKTDATTQRHTIWTLDIARGVLSRLLVDPYGAHGPVWSPDASRVMFGSNRLRGVNAYTVRADGSGEATLVLPADGALHRANDWSEQPALIVYDSERRGQSDLWVASAAPPHEAKPFVATTAYETQGRFSPDVRWIAYTSDESGAPDVYVRRYPDGGAAWRVSTTGGAQAQWRRDGKELFYMATDGKLMAAEVTADTNVFETGPPRALFDTSVQPGLFVDRRNHYVVTPDGQRFLVNVPAEDDNIAPVTIVLNWSSLTSGVSPPR